MLGSIWTYPAEEVDFSGILGGPHLWSGADQAGDRPRKYLGMALLDIFPRFSPRGDDKIVRRWMRFEKRGCWLLPGRRKGPKF